MDYDIEARDALAVSEVYGSVEDPGTWAAAGETLDVLADAGFMVVRAPKRRCLVSAEVADVLDAAADRIEPEGAWTRGAYSRTADGQPAGPSEPTAVCWCALGALYVEAGPRVPLYAAALRALCKSFVGHRPVYVGDWNDDPNRTQAEVVATLREAARRERAS